MPSPNATPTPITPPRVPLIDSRTGLIDRAWYMFFLSLLNAATTVVDNPDVGPNLESLIASYDAALQTLAQEVGTQPPAVDYTEDIANLKKEKDLNPSSEIGELQAQIDNVRQELEVLPRAELGTMSALDQANLPWVSFDTTPQAVPTNTAGTMYWDEADGNQTMNLVMAGGLVTQQIGEEQYYRIKADSTITEGQVIMFAGTVGASGALKGAPATGLTASTALYTMGVATENIATNGWGYVTSFGLVRNINTTGGAESWIDGQILYLNPAVAGGLTKTVPTAPNPKVVVAAVVHAAVNGSLFIRPAFGGKLGEFEGDVQVTTPVNTDLLQYNGTIWQNIPAATVINGAGGAPVVKTANFSVAATENWLINNKSGSTCTATLPTASSYSGRVLHFQNYQAQTLISASSNVVPLAGGAAGTSILLASAGDSATLVSDGSNWLMTQYVPNNILLLE